MTTNPPRDSVASEPYIAQYAALVQPRVAEPILAVGMLSRVVGAHNDRMPSTVLIALTGTYLYCFTYGLRGREMKVHDQVARFSRVGMTAEFCTTNLSDQMDLRLGD